MQPASAAFFVPSPVGRNEPAEAVLEIRPPSIGPEELQQELERFAGRLGVGAADSIRVGPRMTASLVADRECDIVEKDPLDQAVVLAEGAKWRWTVTPRVGGRIRLTVTLTAPVVIEDRETSYRVTSFEETVTVTVTASDRFSDLMKWARDYWVILVACGGALVALFRWLRQRRTR